jgi:hypothetical protein
MCLFLLCTCVGCFGFVVVISCTRIVKLLLAAGSDVMLQNAFKRTPLQYFNQDTEMQQINKRQQQQRTSESETVETTASSSTLTSSKENNVGGSTEYAPPTPGELRMTSAQIDELESQIAEFQRNLTEAGMILQHE